MRIFLIVAGTLSLAVGIIGIFLPLIPTTPLLLLAAACYIRSSPRLYQWLITQKHLGPYILNYRENKVIPVKAKISALSLLWATMLFCIFFVIDTLWVRILLGAIAVGVTVHILSFKSK